MTTAKRDDEVFEDDSPHPGDEGKVQWDEGVVGKGGRGAVYSEEKREEEDEEEEGLRYEGLNSIAVNDDHRRAAWRRKRDLEEDADSPDEWEDEGEEDDDTDSSHPTSNGVMTTSPGAPSAASG